MRPRVMLATVVFFVLCAVSPAFAYNETGNPYIPSDGYGSCGFCHYPGWTGSSYGPHRGYTSSSRACGTCHTVHDAPAP